jgi:hypothetical protein
MSSWSISSASWNSASDVGGDLLESGGRLELERRGVEGISFGLGLEGWSSGSLERVGILEWGLV